MMRVRFPLPAPSLFWQHELYSTGVFFYVGAGCFKTSLVLRLLFEVGYSLSADFLQQWNGALSVEI